MTVEVKRKSVGKIEEPVLPRRNKNLHDHMRLNNNFQLDGVQRAEDTYKHTDVCEHYRKS